MSKKSTKKIKNVKANRYVYMVVETIIFQDGSDLRSQHFWAAHSYKRALKIIAKLAKGYQEHDAHAGFAWQPLSQEIVDGGLLRHAIIDTVIDTGDADLSQVKVRVAIGIQRLVTE